MRICLVLPSVQRNSVNTGRFNLESVVSSVDLEVAVVTPVFSPRVSDNPVRSVIAVSGDSPTHNGNDVVSKSWIIRGVDSSSGEVDNRSGINRADNWTSGHDLVLKRSHGVGKLGVLSNQIGVIFGRDEARRSTETFFTNSGGVAFGSLNPRDSHIGRAVLLSDVVLVHPLEGSQRISSVTAVILLVALQENSRRKVDLGELATSHDGDSVSNRAGSGHRP